jgi:hypothetical protein
MPQIKELEKQLAEGKAQPTSASSATSLNSTSAAGEGGTACCTNGNPLQGAADEAASGGSGGSMLQLGQAGCGGLKGRLLSKQLAWWQHALVTGLSVICTMGYMGWEASWRCSSSSGGMVCSA